MKHEKEKGVCFVHEASVDFYIKWSRNASLAITKE